MIVSRLILLSTIAISCMQAAERADSDLERRFAQTVRPFLNTYCIGCHGGSAPAAKFDLTPYSTPGAVIRDHAQWEHVLERLTTDRCLQCPPNSLPLTPGNKVIDWMIQAIHIREAQKSAGDPGLVLTRRLSNAEYNYTIRDLTGVDIRAEEEPAIVKKSARGFGYATDLHVQNFLECVRTRKTPTAPMRVAFQSTLVVQMANMSLKNGRRYKWNAAANRVEAS